MGKLLQVCRLVRLVGLGVLVVVSFMG
jgi:hypothetical protein